jgi:polar amino acid transport system ATP-binding protein
MKLEIDRLGKKFGDHAVLRNLHLRTGEIRTLALIGPSGGGKSTLLRVIGGLIAAETGTVHINGDKVPTEEIHLQQYRKTIGTVFQAYNLFPHLTALQNILLPLQKVHGLKETEAMVRANEHLKRLGLEAHRDKLPAQLSGGQRQRVAIARAIAIKPRFLLFDEPTSALDPEMTAEVLEVIEELKTEGSDFIIVTHAMAFARRVADEVAFLAEGTIVEAGPAAQIFEAPQSPQARQFLSHVLRY